MMTNHRTLAQLFSAARQKVALAIYLALCTLGIGLSASAQELAPVPNAKEFMLQNFLNRPHLAYPATGVLRRSASAQDASAGVGTLKKSCYTISQVRGTGHTPLLV